MSSSSASEDRTVYPQLLSALGGGSSDQLDMTSEQFQALKDSLHSAGGLIVFTGPTGSGKNSHAYATLAHLADQGARVASLELAPRNDIPGVQCHQVESFSQQHLVLKSLVDIEVVYFREIFDAQDLASVYDAIANGVLIISTLHCHDTRSALERLRNLDAQADATKRVDAPILIQGQRKLDRLCQNCKKSGNVATIKKNPSGECIPKGMANLSWYWPSCCSACRNEPLTGYVGETFIYESREHRIGADEASFGSLVGNMSLSDSALAKMDAGDLSPGDAYRLAVPGSSALIDYPEDFLAWIIRQPVSDFSAQILSLAAEEYINYPRLCIELCSSPDRLDQMQLLMSQDGYFIFNQCEASDGDDIDFRSTRGHFPAQMVLDWFSRHQRLSQDYKLESAVARWERILDSPFQEADYYGHYYYYHQCLAPGREKAAENFDCHTLEWRHIGLDDHSCYPLLTLRLEEFPGDFIDGWNVESRTKLEQLARELLTEFLSAFDSGRYSTGTQALTASQHYAWTHERYLRRLYELSNRRTVRRTDGPDGFFL